MLLRDASEGYVLEAQAENKSHKTVLKLKWHLKKFIEHVGNLPVEKIGPKEVREFILYQQGRGLSPQSVHTDYAVLSSFFRWCITEGLVKTTPLETIKPPKLPQLLPKVLSPEQVEKFLSRLKKDTTMTGRRNLAMVMVFLDCGLRANELVNLKMDDVHLDASFILVRVAKGGKQRVVPISPTLRRQLWRYIGEYRAKFHPREDYLFLSLKGKQMHVETVKSVVKRALKAVDIKGGPHILRHTAATLYIRNGGDLERLRLLLGHSSVQTTQKYTHLIPEDLIKRHSEVSPLESVL